MDDRGFDRLARGRAGPATRRQAVRTAAGAALAAVLAALGGAGADARHRRPTCATIRCASGYVCVAHRTGGGRCVRQTTCPRERRCGGRCCPGGQVCCYPRCGLCGPSAGSCILLACD